MLRIEGAGRSSIMTPGELRSQPTHDNTVADTIRQAATLYRNSWSISPPNTALKNWVRRNAYWHSLPPTIVERLKA